MDLRKYNNQLIRLIDIDGKIFRGICIFEDKDTYEEKQDGLSVKVGYEWVKIFENDIKNIVVLNAHSKDKIK